MPADQNQRSSKVQDIIGYVPHWIIRWGITIIFSTILIILIISYFIKYPDIVIGETTLTTTIPPKDIFVKESGRIQVLVDNNTTVKQNEILGYVKDETNYQDVILLEKSLQSGDSLPDKELELGSISDSYINYLIARDEYFIYSKTNNYVQEIKHLRNQKALLLKLNDNLINQNQLNQEEIELIDEEFRRDSALHASEIISKAAFNEKKINLIKSYRESRELESTVINNKYLVEEINKEINILSKSNQLRELTLLRDLENAVRALRKDILSWKETYVFISPLDGVISFNGFIESNLYLEKNTKLMTVIPQSEEFYARVNIPIVSSGKVNVGQRVNIRLDNYPPHEFGVLKGSVKQISKVPHMNGSSDPEYHIYVELENSLVTTYGITLPNNQYLSGNAEIITKKISLLQRIFNRVLTFQNQ